MATSSSHGWRVRPDTGWLGASPLTMPSKSLSEQFFLVVGTQKYYTPHTAAFGKGPGLKGSQGSCSSPDLEEAGMSLPLVPWEKGVRKEGRTPGPAYGTQSSHPSTALLTGPPRGQSGISGDSSRHHPPGAEYTPPPLPRPPPPKSPVESGNPGLETYAY